MEETTTGRSSVLRADRLVGTIEHQTQEQNTTVGPFVVRWNRLISTTNWEKGQIIGQWRQALIDAGAESTEYSDEAWSRLVGGVTGQHVRRLRRVFERFGQQYQQYEGLYWSHFHAALDWDDAELWLEGAVQSGWSISQMRRQRWEAMGALPAEKPQDGDIVVADTDEDCDPRYDRDLAESGPLPEGPDFGDEQPNDSKNDVDLPQSPVATTDEEVQLVRPFEDLAELPADLAEAFESFKLAILRHKTDRWREIPRQDVLASLDALKELVVAPTMD